MRTFRHGIAGVVIVWIAVSVCGQQKQTEAELRRRISALSGHRTYRAHRRIAVLYYRLLTRYDTTEEDWRQAVRHIHAAIKLFVERGKPAKGDERYARYQNLLGWQGGILCLHAKYPIAPIEKIRAANRCSQLLDRAVHESPADREIRLLRLYSYAHFPPEAEKERQVIDDGLFLLRNTKDTPGNRQTIGDIHLFLADAYGRLGEKGLSEKHRKQAQERK